MRRDLILGIILSLAFHVGVAYVGQYARGGPVKARPKDTVHTIEIKMPPIEPEPPPPDEDQDTPPPDIPPPMQNDVPQIVTQDSFVQTIEPPPPPDTTPVKGVITIPKGDHAWTHMKVFDASQLDQQADPKYDPPPPYPFDLKAQGVVGSVVVEMIIDTNGKVVSAYAKSSTNREFEQSVVSTVRTWTFRPGRKNGHAVVSRAEQEFGFSITPGE